MDLGTLNFLADCSFKMAKFPLAFNNVIFQIVKLILEPPYFIIYLYNFFSSSLGKQLDLLIVTYTSGPCEYVLYCIWTSWVSSTNLYKSPQRLQLRLLATEGFPRALLNVFFPCCSLGSSPLLHKASLSSRFDLNWWSSHHCFRFYLVWT